MKLRFEGVTVTIGDDDPRAIKIRQGYEYFFDGQNLMVSNNKTGVDHDDVLPKLDAGKLTLAQTQKLLAEVLRKMV